MKKIRFTPGDTSYRWDFSKNSPFIKRSIKVFQKDRKSKAKSLAIKKKYYDLFFSNEKESYLSRNQFIFVKESTQKEKKYIEEHELAGNIVEIRFSINKLLDRITEQFETYPQSLFTEADNIRSICLQEGFTIQPIDAFNQIRDWDEFIQVLKSLRDSNGPFKFELMIAVISQYADLCSSG